MTTTDAITEDTPFAAEDDTFHSLSDRPYETQTNWWALNWPDRKTASWLRPAHHPQ